MELSSSELQEGREEWTVPSSTWAGLSPGLCLGPPISTMGWYLLWAPSHSTLKLLYLLAVGNSLFLLAFAPFYIWCGHLGPLTWVAVAQPALQVINNMAQCGSAVCLWYQELVVTQETCQPLWKPNARVTSFQTASHESVWNSQWTPWQSSLIFLNESQVWISTIISRIMKGV